MDTPSAHHNAVRVLSVDDSAEMRILVQASLERRGYSVQSVDCGRAAVAAASREPFDLVILDFDMPGIDGMEVGRALRKNPMTRAAMIAMHTSLDEAQVRRGFDDFGMFLAKPCGPLQLGEQAARLLQRSPAFTD